MRVIRTSAPLQTTDPLYDTKQVQAMQESIGQKLASNWTRCDDTYCRWGTHDLVTMTSFCFLVLLLNVPDSVKLPTVSPL